MGTKQLRSAYKLGKGQYEKAALEFDGAILKQGGDAYDIYERFLDETPEGKEFLRASARGLVLGESVVAFEKAIEAAQKIIEIDPQQAPEVQSFLKNLPQQ